MGIKGQEYVRGNVVGPYKTLDAAIVKKIGFDPSKRASAPSNPQDPAKASEHSLEKKPALGQSETCSSGFVNLDDPDADGPSLARLAPPPKKRKVDSKPPSSDSDLSDPGF